MFGRLFFCNMCSEWSAIGKLELMVAVARPILCSLVLPVWTAGTSWASIAFSELVYPEAGEPSRQDRQGAATLGKAGKATVTLKML